VLVYVELEGVATTTTPEGVRSETSARAKFLAWNGISLREQVLGRAVDVGDTQRDGYYLSHQFDIPADFPEGEYELELTVDDVAGGTSATTRVVAESGEVRVGEATVGVKTGGGVTTGGHG
jgi:hypothetical protein